VEEYLYRISLPKALVFAFGIPLQSTIIAGNSTDPYFWYSLFFLLINLYFRLKEIFLNPKFVGSVYGDLENPTNELAKDLRLGLYCFEHIKNF